MSGAARRSWQGLPSDPPRPLHWGFHRLVDEWARSIVAEAGIRPGDLVVDIGAGDGALTTHLLRAGARVLAVELHPERRRRLLSRCGCVELTVISVDAARLRWPRRPFKVVANPPYDLTIGLVRQLLSPHVNLISADLVLQRRMVLQIIRAPPGRKAPYDDRLTLDRGLVIPRSAFRPMPRVDSAVLQIRRR